MFKNIWEYRYFILGSIRNELVTKFSNSKLGALWIIINPLSQVLIYALILSNVLAAKLPGIENKYAYAIYLMAGLLAWSLFNETLIQCTNLFLSQANLMKKMKFPRITLPSILLGVNLINNGLLFLAVLIIFFILGHQFASSMFWLLPLTGILCAFSLGIGLFLGVMNVFVRDIGQTLAIVLQVWFWFTPIVYPETIIPESYRYLLKLNPLYHFTTAYQDVLVYGRSPDFKVIILISFFSLAFLAFSLFIFRQAADEMVDVL